MSSAVLVEFMKAQKVFDIIFISAKIGLDGNAPSPLLPPNSPKPSAEKDPQQTLEVGIKFH